MKPLSLPKLHALISQVYESKASTDEADAKNNRAAQPFHEFLWDFMLQRQGGAG